jgi:hypothetical protein
MKDLALLPLPLFNNTIEHAHAVSVLKSQYTMLVPTQQCLRLVHEYNKPFEYQTNVIESFESCEKNIWEACIWDPSSRMVCDILINIDLITVHTGTVRLVARNQRIVDEFIVSESRDGNVSMPLSGIPTIALQYCKLYLVYEGPNKPLGFKLRCRVLPSAARRLAAQLPHNTDHYVISMGELMHHDVCSCVVS